MGTLQSKPVSMNSFIMILEIRLQDHINTEPQQVSFSSLLTFGLPTLWNQFP